MFTQEPGPPRGTVAALGACLFRPHRHPAVSGAGQLGCRTWTSEGHDRMTHAGQLAWGPLRTSALISAGLLVPVLPRSHGQKEALCARWAGGQRPPRASSSGPGRDPKWRSPGGDQQRLQSQVSLTSSASGHTAAQPGARAHPPSPQLSPAPSLMGASFWSRAPSRSRDAGRVSGPAGASPALASWCLEPLPVVHHPPVPGGLCPREGGSFRVSSQHILWPVPPILPPTAGAGPSALPGVLSDSPFFPRGGGRAAV